jgi:hypothetical protein
MLRGGCLCSAVRYEIDGSIGEPHHCHCSQCRKFHGAAFATYVRSTTSDLRIVSGAERLTAYRSPALVRRTFCSRCGASLFFAHDAAPELVWIAVGTLDEEARLDADTSAGATSAWRERNARAHAERATAS